MIVTYDYYANIHGSCAIDRGTFERLNYDAERYIINATTGLSGFEKLVEAFPTNERDVEAVKRTICKIIVVLNDIEQAQKAEAGTVREDGTLLPARISSISSGAESISFASPTTQVTSAVFNESAKKSYINDIIRDGLQGARDKNGVHLLYMG